MGNTCGFPTSLCMSEGYASDFGAKMSDSGTVGRVSHAF